MKKIPNYSSKLIIKIISIKFLFSNLVNKLKKDIKNNYSPESTLRFLFGGDFSADADTLVCGSQESADI